MALGSTFELETQLEICRELDYFQETELLILRDIVKLQKRIKSLINYAKTAS